MNHMDWIYIIQMLAPIVGPLLTQLLRMLLPSIPPVLLPVVATAFGTGAALIGDASMANALALGGSGVAVQSFYREVQKTRA